jgi:hypothetical protein
MITSDIGATVTVDSKKVAVAAGAHETLQLDLVTKLGAANVSQNDGVTFAISVEANGETATDTLTLTGSGVTELAARELAKVEHGPLLFAGETAGPSKAAASLVVVGAPSGPLILVGSAKTFADVDLVGVATPSDRRFPCPNGAALLYIDTVVKVYARRTGSLVGTKSLSADRTTCPPTPSTEPLKSAVREDDTKRVLAEMLKK